MTEVLHSPSHFITSQTNPSDNFFSNQTQSYNTNPNFSFSIEEEDLESVVEEEEEKGEFSVFGVLIGLLRKSIVSSCNASDREIVEMNIGGPTNVRHVSHVTFDNFDGFLGLPDEFEPDVPRRAPSASSSVFGVSTESMQLSFDGRGNCVPTILLSMQRRLYAQGGLQEEGIFRIAADNSQEEFVRDQLNAGVIPDDIDVHCLAGRIKAWFRELPTGVLDPLSPEDVMHCESEESCTELVKQLPATEGALLDWAVNLMADVVQEEHYNRMNAHNIAMVFAPNMTQMVDPLTALMYAVQVMNFLKTLITKTLQDRQDSNPNPDPTSYAGPPDESGPESPSQHSSESYHSESELESESESEYHSEDDSFSNSPNTHHDDGSDSDDSPFHWQSFKGLQASLNLRSGPMFQAEHRISRFAQSSNANVRKEPVPVISNRLHPVGPIQRLKTLINLNRLTSRGDVMEAWR